MVISPEGKPHTFKIQTTKYPNIYIYICTIYTLQEENTEKLVFDLTSLLLIHYSTEINYVYVSKW